MVKHYEGDDSDLELVMGGVVQAFAGWTVEEYTRRSRAFLRAGTHPSLGRSFLDCAFVPMVDLLRFLEDNGFTVYIASGGDRDFMRPVTEEHLRHPARARHRQSRARSRTTTAAARSSTSPSPTSSTTGP